MVDVLADPQMIGFKRGKSIYQIRDLNVPPNPNNIIEEDYRIPYKSSKAGCI